MLAHGGTRIGGFQRLRRTKQELDLWAAQRSAGVAGGPPHAGGRQARIALPPPPGDSCGAPEPFVSGPRARSDGGRPGDEPTQVPQSRAPAPFTCPGRPAGQAPVLEARARTGWPDPCVGPPEGACIHPVAVSCRPASVRCSSAGNVGASTSTASSPLAQRRSHHRFGSAAARSAFQTETTFAHTGGKGRGGDGGQEVTVRLVRSGGALGLSGS